jgi:hypothetical protein
MKVHLFAIILAVSFYRPAMSAIDSIHSRYEIDPYPPRALVLPQDNGVTQLPRQVAYSSDIRSITIGGVRFSAGNSEFTKVAANGCYVEYGRAMSDYDYSKVSFCVPTGPNTRVVSNPTVDRVRIQDQTAPGNGILTISDNQLMKFEIFFSDRKSISFEFVQTQILWNDGWLSEDKKYAILSLANKNGLVSAVEDKKVLATEDDNRFFAPSFPIRPRMFLLPVPMTDPTITRETVMKIQTKTYIDGLSVLPVKSKHPYIENTNLTTYQKQIQLKARVASGALPSSDDQLFTSKPIDLPIGRISLAKFDIELEEGIASKTKRKIKMSAPVYQGYMSEASVRGGGLLDKKGDITVAGELAVLFFPPRIWSATAVPGFDFNRLGFGLRYYSSLFIADGFKTPEKFSILQAEARMHFNQGIWQRDQIVGMMAVYNQVAFRSLGLSPFGLGLYWGRSMPKPIDNFFNWFWPFRFEKYVDMSLIYMPVDIGLKSLDSPGVTLDFHGKMFLSTRLYFEAGFGLRSFYLKGGIERLALSQPYGTAGFGMMF